MAPIGGAKLHSCPLEKLTASEEVIPASRQNRAFPGHVDMVTKSMVLNRKSNQSDAKRPRVFLRLTDGMWEADPLLRTLIYRDSGQTDPATPFSPRTVRYREKIVDIVSGSWQIYDPQIRSVIQFNKERL
jgi:hypothetical protein